VPACSIDQYASSASTISAPATATHHESTVAPLETTAQA